MTTEADEIERIHTVTTEQWQQAYDRSVPAAQRAALGERVTPEYYSKERLRERYPGGAYTSFEALKTAVIQRDATARINSSGSPQVLVESTVERVLALLDLSVSQSLIHFDEHEEGTRIEASSNTLDAAARASLALEVRVQPYRRVSFVIQTLREPVAHVKDVAAGSMRKWPGYVGPLTVFAD